MSATEDLSRFKLDLGSLVAKAMVASRGHPEVHADIIESLAKSIGMTIALACRGDAKAVSTMLGGVEAYIADEAVGMSKMAGAIFAKPSALTEPSQYQHPNCCRVRFARSAIRKFGAKNRMGNCLSSAQDVTLRGREGLPTIKRMTRGMSVVFRLMRQP